MKRHRTPEPRAATLAHARMPLSRHTVIYRVADAAGTPAIMITLETAEASDDERAMFESQIAQVRSYASAGLAFELDGVAADVVRVSDGTLVSGQRYVVLHLRRAARYGLARHPRRRLQN